MQEHPSIRTFTAFMAVAMLVLTVPLMIYARLVRSWWWIALPTNLACLYMLARTAFWPWTSPQAPAYVIVASAVWMLYYLIVLLTDVGEGDEGHQDGIHERIE